MGFQSPFNMKFLQIAVVTVLILCLYLDTTSAKTFCKQLADGDLTIKAMGPSGTSLLIVTETKEVFKLPLDSFYTYNLIMANDYEPLSLKESKFPFTSNPLWLTNNDSSIILLNSADGQFYRISFQDKGATAERLTLETPLEMPVQLFLSDSIGNSVYLLNSSLFHDLVSVSTSKRTLSFVQPTQVQPNNANVPHTMFELPEEPTAGFSYDGKLCLVTRELLVWYEFKRYTDWQPLITKTPLKRFFRCTSRNPWVLAWVFLIGTISVIFLFTIGHFID